MVAGVFDVGQEQALVEIWKYEGKIILTWEQCAHGKQYDESSYSHDERHVFDSVDQAYELLEKRAAPLQAFEPEVGAG